MLLVFLVACVVFCYVLWRLPMFRIIMFIYRSLTREQGRLAGSIERVPRIIARNEAVKLDPTTYKKYLDLCKCRPSTADVSICFPEMYFIGLIIDVLTHADFGLSPFGVVRLRQTIVQHERISLSAEEKFDLTARLTEYRQTQKGIEFDIKFEMSNERHVTVWESLGTFISRNKATQKRQHQPRNQQPSSTTDSVYADEIRFDVAGNCGIEYAKISGDYNPYHLYPFTARLLGYPKPMAHGLWTATRSLVEISVTKNLERTRFVRELYVEFKRPLFIPSQVALRFGETDSLVYSFRVESAITGEPNLIAQAKFY